MRKLSLSPEELRVDSFSTQTPGAAGRGTVQGHVWPVTRPECANTVYLTCDPCDSIIGCG